MAVVGYTNYSYRWRSGFVNAAQLTDTYALRNFPRQTDMGSSVDWLDPQGTNTYNRAAMTELSLYGRAKFLGIPNFTWSLPSLTPQMTDYLLHNAAYFDSAAYLDSTVSTWNGARDRWEIIWAIASLGTISEMAQTGFQRGFRLLTINFRVEQDAPT